MKFKLVFFSILSLSHFSCKKKISIPQAKLSELNEMEAFWNSKVLYSYTVTQEMNCYCAYESTLPQEVTVRNGIIESVGGVPYDPSRHSRFFTIKESFQL